MTPGGINPWFYLALSGNTDLSEGSEIFPDSILCGLGVQTPDKDLLGGLLLHGHRLLGVDWTAVQSVFLLLQNLNTQLQLALRANT